MATPSVEFQNVTKSFAEHKVLSGVSFSVNAGDIVALMGENGAGKSTLMRLLAGVYPEGTYSGHIRIQGGVVRFTDVRASKKAGVAMIHQELGLFPELTVAENILLEEIAVTHPFHIQWDSVFETAQKFVDSLGFALNARIKVGELSTGSAQLVEISRALRQNAQILIMDEPTSALTETETAQLFIILRRLQDEGKTIFYVSHRMEEITQICNKTVVLRDGVIAGVDETKNLTRDKIIQWMVGREVSQIYPKKMTSHKPAQAPLLNVKNLTLFNKTTGRCLVNDVSFDLNPGEVLGLGGLMGAGRSELALAVFGFFGGHSPLRREYTVTGDTIFSGQKVQWLSPRDAQRSQVAMLTEDRKGLGLFLNRSAAENMTVGIADQLGPWSRAGVIDQKKEQAIIAQLALELQVRGPGLHVNVETYSGGNQQKVYLAKCLALRPKLLILDEPTRGVDIGAKIEIYEMISALAQRGVGILLISSEMPELLGLSDRVLVLREGQLSATFTRPQAGSFDPEHIMHAASL